MADIDGDGKEDLVLFRSGQWRVNTKADATTQYVFQFGGSRGDVPLLGDVNGDGQVDLIIYNRGTLARVAESPARDERVVRAWRRGRRDPDRLRPQRRRQGRLVTFNNGVWSAKSISPAATSTFNYGAAGDVPLYFGPGAIPDARLDAARFLHQATFGPVAADIARVQQIGYAAFIDEQFNAPHTELPYMPWWPQNRPQSGNPNSAPPGPQYPFCLYSSYAFGVPYNSGDALQLQRPGGHGNQCQRDVYTNFRLQNELFKRALTAPDQLRHRVAWALSQILVTSNMQDPIAYPMRDYQQLLHTKRSASSRTCSTASRSRRGWATTSTWCATTARWPRSNAACPERELRARAAAAVLDRPVELAPDGTLLLDASNNPIPTYSQDDIVRAVARV